MIWSCNCSNVAVNIVSKIADARMSYDLIESVGYWIAQYSAGSELEPKMVTFAQSILDNVKDYHDKA